MFNFKKIGFLLIVVSLILVACQPAAPAATVATDKPAAPAATEMPKGALSCSPNCKNSDLVVGFIQTGSEGGWRAANTASFKETATKMGINLKFYDFVISLPIQKSM
jgi:ABC-type sugar transport system substrate-binding protein